MDESEALSVLIGIESGKPSLEEEIWEFILKQNNSMLCQQSGMKHVMNLRGRRCCPTYGRKTEREKMKEKERASCCSQTDNSSDSVRQQLTATLLFLLEG